MSAVTSNLSVASQAIYKSTFSVVSLKEYFRVLAGLAALTLCVYFFQIEENLRLLTLLQVTLPAFAIYALLPLKYRMPFYFSITCITIVLLFGLSIGLLIILMVLLFFGITLLPVPWKTKAVISLGFTLLLLGIRTEYIHFANGATIAKVVGVLLMFRSILYLYELQHEKEDPGIWKRLNYFFLLPNVIFFLFPIVDYKTFVRGLYNQPAIATYQRGIHWMFRGIIHLLAYRLLYYYLLPSMMEVRDIYDLIQYLGVSYALILRLSGIFHFSAGMLCLFGFDLPRTFNNYFLTSSFSDLWHRINVYWRDFVMKVFYFPIFFRFKKRDDRAVFITVLIVFFFNWFMHAYQWLWIRGSFLFQLNDILFWSALGIFMAVNAVLLRHRKKKTNNTSEFVVRDTFIRCLKIIGMFATMSLLWGFWISPTISAWWAFTTGIEAVTGQDVIIIMASVFILALAGTGIFYLGHRLQWERSKERFWLIRNRVVVGLFALLLVGSSAFSSTLANLLPMDMEPILTEKLNEDDEETIFQGYYDQLIISNNFNSKVWETNKVQEEELKSLWTTGIVQPLDDILRKAIKPNEQVIFKRSLLTSNDYGLRDKNYALEKRTNDLRIALLGGSMEMGSGVKDDETFENILELALNKQQVFPSYDSIEIINFAISGLHMPQHVAIAERRVKPFGPDVLIYTAHRNELNRATRTFGQTIAKKSRVNAYPFLYNLSDALSLEEGMDDEEMMRRLLPYREKLYQWGVKRILAVCEENNILPIYLYLPAPGDEENEEERIALREVINTTPFYFIDKADLFGDLNPLELTLAEYDQHPNAVGHQRIAEVLFELFTQDTVLRQKIENHGE